MTVASVYSAYSVLRPLPRPLRIVIPGGTGHLGRILDRQFSANGHHVTALTRAWNPQGQYQRTVFWDGSHAGDWIKELDGADVLVNLAGRSVDCRYTARNRKEILESRVESTKAIGRAIGALRHPPRLWLNASTATIYRDSYDREMDEMGELGGSEPGVPRSWKFSIEVAREWENVFFESRTPHTRKIALRTAMVMSPDEGGVFAVLMRLVRLGLAGQWDRGRQWMSWIHEIDFCRAVEFLIAQQAISGVVNVAAPNPLRNVEFLAVLRNAWGIRFGFPSTQWMLEIGTFFRRTETELLLKSRRVVPRRLLEHGFQFLFSEWPEAARDLVQSWRLRAQSAER